MAVQGDALRLTPPRVYLVRMVVFLALAALIASVLYRQILSAFMANPLLNGLIFLVLLIGVVLAFLQVGRLFREVKWVNNIRRGEQRITMAEPPVLLAPMASLLGERAGHEVISTLTLRSVLDSIGARLDESRDTLRYLTGLLVFLGLLGTFWGLLETVSSIGKVISAMPTNGNSTVLFDELKAGLAAPLAGMGISFSSSLFGLAGSLILGFLDLQAGQAQSRFFYELEDWLSTMTQDVAQPAGLAAVPGDLKPVLDRLVHLVGESGGGKASATAIANLAEGIQALIQHMRTEQQLLRNWVEYHADQQQEVKRLLQKLSRDDGSRG